LGWERLQKTGDGKFKKQATANSKNRRRQIQKTGDGKFKG
jgi:hypothetical protein